MFPDNPQKSTTLPCRGRLFTLEEFLPSQRSLPYNVCGCSNRLRIDLDKVRDTVGRPPYFDQEQEKARLKESIR